MDDKKETSRWTFLQTETTQVDNKIQVPCHKYICGDVETSGQFHASASLPL